MIDFNINFCSQRWVPFSSLSVRSRYEHFPSIIPFDKQYFTFADNDVLDDKFLQCDVGIYRRRTEKTGTWF